jgi:hypothetical protein
MKKYAYDLTKSIAVYAEKYPEEVLRLFGHNDFPAEFRLSLNECNEINSFLVKKWFCDYFARFKKSTGDVVDVVQYVVPGNEARFVIRLTVMETLSMSLFGKIFDIFYNYSYTMYDPDTPSEII